MNGLAPLLLAMALAPGSQRADTVVTLTRGDRIVVQNVSGALTVEAWDRDDLDVGGDDAEVVAVSRADGRVLLRPGPHRRGRTSDLMLRLPAWAALEVRGVALDVSVRGMEAGAAVRVVEGDIEVAQGVGTFVLSTVEGEITARAVRGAVRADARSDDVLIRDVTGQVRATTGSGDVDLLRIHSDRVFAEAVEGNVTFLGGVAPEGSYDFSVHEGDVDVTVQAGVSARVSVSTFDGEFMSDFPVRVERYEKGRTFEFTLGEGGARLSVEVFDGSIRLRKADGPTTGDSGTDGKKGEGR